MTTQLPEESKCVNVYELALNFNTISKLRKNLAKSLELSAFYQGEINPRNISHLLMQFFINLKHLTKIIESIFS